MNEETFEGRGGLKIFTRSWRPEGKARGVVRSEEKQRAQTCVT